MLHRKSRFDAASGQSRPRSFLANPVAELVAKLAPCMKLHSSVTSGLLAITAYDAESIAVNGRRLSRSFLLTPHRLIEDWAPASFDSLTESDLRSIAELGCPIVLLGTGPRQRFPAPVLLRPLIEQRIGVEVMDTYAACRTYNILMAEGRDVAAALIIECAT